MTALSRFKHAIADQICRATHSKPEELMQLMRMSKSRKEGHISISLPKLNAFLGNPVKNKRDLQPWSESMVKDFQFCNNRLINKSTSTEKDLFFTFNEPEFVRQVLQQVYHDDKTYGWSHIPKPSLTENTVLVDYSSPNIAKPFHAGHLRSTIIGNFVKRIHEALGYRVIGINYLGDWGKQYGLLAVGFERYGDEKLLLSNPIHHLYQVYVKINADASISEDISKQANKYFKRMEEGDPKAIQQWTRFRDMSIKSYTSIYKRLNIEFDVYSGESEVNNYIPKALAMLKDQHLITHTDDGASAVNLEEYQLGNAVVQRADGTSLYITRDLASILRRKELYSFAKAFYVVGREQSNYFKQVFKIAEKMIPSSKLDLQHIGFGRIQGMSTRKGSAVFLQDILDTAKERILEYMTQDSDKSQIENIDYIADQLGVSAIMIQDMKSKRDKNYEFAWDRVTDAKGDTGVFLQYAHARACGIERKAGIAVDPQCNFELLKEKEAIDLVELIAQFPETVQSAFSTLEPCTIVNYLFKLSHATSTASKFLRVKDMDIDTSKARLLLFWSARATLRNGLYLLGIKPIKKM